LDASRRTHSMQQSQEVSVRTKSGAANPKLTGNFNSFKQAKT